MYCEDKTDCGNKSGVVSFVCGILGLLVLGLGIVWFAQGSDFFLYRMFAPKYEAVRRETFEESKAYNQGMVQELQSMQFQYVQADAEHKKALASVILHRAADYPRDKMPEGLRAFVYELERDRLSKK